MKTSFIFTVNQIPKKWNKKNQSYCSHKYLNNKRTFCAVLVHCLLERSSHLRCSVRKTVLKNFSCEFCKISKNTFFPEHVWATGFLLIPCKPFHGEKIFLSCEIKVVKADVNFTKEIHLHLDTFHLRKCKLSVRNIIFPNVLCDIKHVHILMKSTTAWKLTTFIK